MGEQAVNIAVALQASGADLRHSGAFLVFSVITLNVDRSQYVVYYQNTSSNNIGETELKPRGLRTVHDQLCVVVW